MSKECCTFKCGRLPASQKHKVVWLIDGKPYCNHCFLDHYECNEVGRERIVRLYSDEMLYEDQRRQKRTKRTKTGDVNGNGIHTPATHAVHA